MLHHVDWQTVAGISKDRTASIFRFKESKQSSELPDFEDDGFLPNVCSCSPIGTA